AGLNSEDAQVKRATQSTLIVCLRAIIRLLHPFMPFVTEEIYSVLPHTEKACCLAAWPTPVEGLDLSHNEEVDQLISVIKTIRQVRVDYNLKPSAPLAMTIRNAQNQPVAVDAPIASIYEKMCKASWKAELDGEMLVRPILGGSLSIPMSDVVDLEEEKAKLKKEAEHLNAEIKRAEGMLSNERFVAKAPAEKVEAERKKLETYKQQLDIVQTRLREIEK
ncbi:MAG: class I tRNA ligase family protein, partial [Holdemania filiformis]